MSVVSTRWPMSAKNLVEYDLVMKSGNSNSIRYCEVWNIPVPSFDLNSFIEDPW